MPGASRAWLMLAWLTGCAHAPPPAAPEPALEMQRGPPPTHEPDTPRLPPEPAPEPLVLDGMDLPPPPTGELAPRPEGWPFRVIAALNAAEAGPGIQGEQAFQVIICRDAPHRIELGEGTLSDLDRAAILRALENANVPDPPGSLTEKLGDGCRPLAYTFTWTPDGVR